MISFVDTERVMQYEYELDQEPYCEKCNGPTDWQDCWVCGGKGGRGWEELQDDDPLWYSPGDWESCDECGGKGGWDVCLNSNCKTTGV